MSEPSCRHQPRRTQKALVHPVNGFIHHAASFFDESGELDHKGRTPAERHKLFMTGFRNILQDEGLRSPSYYHDKSTMHIFPRLFAGRNGHHQGGEIGMGLRGSEGFDQTAAAIAAFP